MVAAAVVAAGCRHNSCFLVVELGFDCIGFDDNFQQPIQYRDLK